MDPSTSGLKRSLDNTSIPIPPSPLPQEKKRKTSHSKPNNFPLPSPTPPVKPLHHLHSLLWKEFTKQLDQTTTLDSTERFPTIFRSLQPIILDSAASSSTATTIRKWTNHCASSALEIYIQNRDAYHAAPDASPLLGTASRRMYKFLRKELDIPFLRTSMLRSQNAAASSTVDVKSSALGGDSQFNGAGEEAMASLTTGGWITRIYQSIRAGGLYSPVMECLAEAEESV